MESGSVKGGLLAGVHDLKGRCFLGLRPPLNSQGHAIVNGIRRIAHVFGNVTSFKAYLDISSQSPKSVSFRSDLQSSGVSMIDCPHNGKKDVVDKMILVDMLAYAVDNPSPATIILIAGDRDYAYAISTLRLRQYSVVLIVPPAPNIPQSLESQASVVVDWNFAILGKRTETDTSPVRQPYRNLDEDVFERLSREIRDSNEDPAVTLLSSSLPTPPAHTRRVSVTEELQPPVFEWNTDSDNVTQPKLSRAPKKAASIIPETPGIRPRFGSRARYVTQSTQTVPNVDRSPDSPLKKNNALSDESLADDRVSTADEIQDATRDPYASIIARLERNPNGPGVPHTTGLGNFPPSPLPIVPYDVDAKSAPLDPSLHARTISYGSAPQNVVPAVVPLSSADPHKWNDTITAPKSTNTGSVSAVMDDCILPSDQAALMDAFGLGDDVPNVSIGSPLLTGADHPSRTANSAESCHTPSDTYILNSSSVNDSPPATEPSVTPMSRASSSTSIISDSNVSMSNVGIDPQQVTSFSSDNNDESLGCQVPPIESMEDKIRRLTPPQFIPLINQLLLEKSKGNMKPSRSDIASDLVRCNKDVYKHAGVTRFAEYTSLAAKASVIELGGGETGGGGAWMALHPNFRQEIDAPKSSAPSIVYNNNPPTSHDDISYTKTSFIASTPPLSIASQGTTETTPKSNASPLLAVVPISLCFQPLVVCLSNIHNNGLAKPPWSAVALILGRAVYSEAGTSSPDEYLAQAVDDGVVQCGGDGGGDVWVKLHPDVLNGKRSC